MLQEHNCEPSADLEMKNEETEGSKVSLFLTSRQLQDAKQQSLDLMGSTFVHFQLQLKQLK